MGEQIMVVREKRNVVLRSRQNVENAQWPITATAITKTNTINKKFCLHVKKVCFHITTTNSCRK